MGTLKLKNTLKQLLSESKLQDTFNSIELECKEEDSKVWKYIKNNKDEALASPNDFIITTMTKIPYIYRTIDSYKDILINKFSKYPLREFSDEVLGELPEDNITEAKVLKVLIRIMNRKE